MTNEILRNTALSVAVLVTPMTAAAESFAGAPHSMGAMERPSGGEYHHESDGAMRGAGSGALMGAIAGGPPGALAGLVIGGSFGEAAQRHQEADEQRAELAELRAQNKRLSYELAAAREAREAKQAELARLKQRQARDMIADALALDVLFATDSAELTSEGRQRIAELAGLLERDPAMSVTLVGQADRRGGEQYNRELSERRAAAVRDALVEQGIRPDRLALEAVGEQRADAPVDDPDGLARDRRVTIDLHAKSSDEEQVAGADGG